MSRMEVASREYKDQSLVLSIIGGVLLLIGVGSAFLGPAEMYCFYLFSEGGRFHYEGFGFGSFMFGNIASQIIGYYLIAMVLIPLGYGHLKACRWARPLSLAMLGFWLVAGIPLMVVFLFILLSSKEMSLAGAVVAVVLLGLSYFVIPGLLIRYYRSRDVRLTFEARDPASYWVERLPLPILVLCGLDLFYAVALHVPVLFSGIFPFFGTFLFDLEGILLADLAIMCLVCLTWGTLRQKAWAWWGSLLYFILLAFSFVLTLARSSLADILAGMRFPPTEMEALKGLPFHGLHLAVLVGLPLLITLGVVIGSKRYFGARKSVT